MKIYYQGEPGSYSHLASKEIEKKLNVEVEDVLGLLDFDSVWDKVSHGFIGVLPIENSYAGTIHHNAYNFLSYDHKIIGEYNFEVRHCLLSLETDVNEVKEMYSHPQALSQTYKYAKGHNMRQKPYGDTAGAAKMLLEKQKRGAAAVASELAAKIYNLNILDSDIQDQDGNTTKFLIIVGKEAQINFSDKKNRTTVLFTTHHTSGSLYDALGILAKRSINMTKIESIPTKNKRFAYSFWLTFEGSRDDQNIIDAIEELSTQTESFQILGKY